MQKLLSKENTTVACFSTLRPECTTTKIHFDKIQNNVTCGDRINQEFIKLGVYDSSAAKPFSATSSTDEEFPIKFMSADPFVFAMCNRLSSLPSELTKIHKIKLGNMPMIHEFSSNTAFDECNLIDVRHLVNSGSSYDIYTDSIVNRRLCEPADAWTTDKEKQRHIDRCSMNHRFVPSCSYTNHLNGLFQPYSSNHPISPLTLSLVNDNISYGLIQSDNNVVSQMWPASAGALSQHSITNFDTMANFAPSFRLRKQHVKGYEDAKMQHMGVLTSSNIVQVPSILSSHASTSALARSRYTPGNLVSIKNVNNNIRECRNMYTSGSEYDSAIVDANDFEHSRHMNCTSITSECSNLSMSPNRTFNFVSGTCALNSKADLPRSMLRTTISSLSDSKKSDNETKISSQSWKSNLVEIFVKCHCDKFREFLDSKEDVYIVSYRGVILHAEKQEQLPNFWVLHGMITKIYWLKSQIRQSSFKPKSNGCLRLCKAEVHLTTTSLRKALETAGKVTLCCRSSQEGGCNRILNADRFPIEGHSRKVRCVDCFGLYKLPHTQRRKIDQGIKRRASLATTTENEIVCTAAANSFINNKGRKFNTQNYSIEPKTRLNIGETVIKQPDC